MKPSKIFNELGNYGISRSMVYRTVKRLQETGNIADRPKSGRPRSIRTKKMKESVRLRIHRNRRRTMGKLAKSLGISKTSVFRLIREDLMLLPFKKRRCYGLTVAQIKKRFERAKHLISLYAGKKLDQIIFSDEKLFSIEEKCNPQNDRIYAASIEDIPEDMRTVHRFAHESKVMVWAGVSKIGKLPLVFVEPGVKINANYYSKNVLKKVLKPESDKLYQQGNWIFQQDSAPAHKSRKVQNWLKNEIPEFISTLEWPPNSPDLNPLDYSIWGKLEEIVTKKRHLTMDELKDSLLQAWEN